MSVFHISGVTLESIWERAQSAKTNLALVEKERNAWSGNLSNLSRDIGLICDMAESAIRDRDGANAVVREEDRLVTVCDKCGTASCWHGIFMCDHAASAGLMDKTVKELDLLAAEHPGNYSIEQVRKNTGQEPKYVPAQPIESKAKPNPSL